MSNIQKLFSERIEIFSTVEFSKVSILTGIVKISLKVPDLIHVIDPHFAAVVLVWLPDCLSKTTMTNHRAYYTSHDRLKLVQTMESAFKYAYSD